MPLPAEWLGLALRSESNMPHEWPYIGWVIRNRVESGPYPNAYESVITAPKQFSYFNKYQNLEDEEEMFTAALTGYAGDATGDNALEHAAVCALDVIRAHRWQAPFGPKVWHFWSPISMKPPGSDPRWAKDLYRVFTPYGVDSWRFKFGETK